MHTTNIRRGNALILVVGVLVLLVLVATAFITRTQSARAVAVAQRDTSLLTDRARFIGRNVANELAVALFPRLLTTGLEQTAKTSANARRVASSPETLRYGHDPNYLYNFAPYDVVPWTNPPDFDVTNNNNVDLTGADNPFGGPSFGDSRWLRDTEPQRADLVDMIGQGVWGSSTVDGTPETFTHWRHLTNLSRSSNAWRVVKDASDILDGGLLMDLDIPVEQWPNTRPQRVSGWQGLALSPTSGYPALEVGGRGFSDIWDDWFLLDRWVLAQENPLMLPQNFLDLTDLDGDGIHNEEGERALDAYVPETNRWFVERVLTDTDGDGFTDALWHLFPNSLGANTRQLVAISITDNSALGNMNVATQFIRSDNINGSHDTDGFSPRGEATRGHTPADLAIVGQNDSGGGVFNSRVGFMDNLANLPGNDAFLGNQWVFYDQVGYPDNGIRVKVDWLSTQWNNRDNSSMLDELGVDGNPVFEGSLNPTDDSTSLYGRLWYWQLAGRSPFEATFGLRPYTISDELEMRVVEGNNYQTVGSRFERSVNDIIGFQSEGEIQNQFLRSDYQYRHEASELRDQLDNRQLLFDNRRKLTMFSGARNDLLPPWLRWQERFWKRHNPEGFDPFPTGYATFDFTHSHWSELFPGGGLDLMANFISAFPFKLAWEATIATMNNGDALEWTIQNWLEQSRTKVDLREYYSDFTFGDAWWESHIDGRLTFAERAPLQLLLAMTDMQESGTSLGNASTANAPLGTFTDTAGASPFNTNVQFNANTFGADYYNQARLMAAGFASNMLAYRDEDSNWRMHSTKSFLPDPANLPTGDAIARSSQPLTAALSPPVLGRQANNAPSIIPIMQPNDGNITGPNQQAVQMLGLEAQPFILEAFIGHVHGAETSEEYGACCFDGGICEEGISEHTCSALPQGVFKGADTLCDDIVCEFGACCMIDGGCIIANRETCEDPDNTYGGAGTYLGDGTTCEDTPCEGACCVLGVDEGNLSKSECVEVSSVSCAQIFGVFNGTDTECASTPCSLLGSCCLASGSCIDIINASACDSLNGTFTDFRCVTDPCIGACCVAFASCIEVDETGCIDVGGNFLGLDQECLATSCTTDGACCLGSSGCEDMQSQSECDTVFGIFLAGDTCVNVPCFGSCCLTDGTCDQVSLVTCDALLGEFIQGGDCSNEPCRSACCFPTGGCDNFLAETCADFGGVFFGDGVFCDTTPCVPVGACCLPDDPDDDSDGGCLDLMVEGCDDVGGTFLASETCGSAPCGTNVRGACCMDTGFCQNVVSVEVCDALNGVFQGEKISCSESPCAVSACCLDDATCIEVLDKLCVPLGGTPKPGFLCAVLPCDSACCLPDLSCVDMTLAECTVQLGTFHEFEMCVTSPCEEEAACCIGTGICDILSISACAAIGGTSQVGSSNCDDCFDGVEGSCCMRPIGCITIAEVTCGAIGGDWTAGNCDDLNICATGSCCLEFDETDHCIEVFSEDSCVNGLGGTFHDGVFCDEEPCVGACCLWAGGCEEMSQSSCEDMLLEPGVFQGLDVECADTPCVALGGSCCLPSGTCVDLIGDQSFIDHCLFLEGAYRTNEFCAETECGGACCLCPSECTNLTEDQCAIVGGSYLGTATLCVLEPCPKTGTCCYPSSSCLEVADESCCLQYGGTFTEDANCVDDPCTAYFIVDNVIGDDLGTEYSWSDFQGTVSVVQFANPFDREIDLFDYSVEWFGKGVNLDTFLTDDQRFLPPSTPSNPATLILYSMPFAIPEIPDIGDRDFVADWLDFLDLDPEDHPANAIIVEVPSGDWGTNRETEYDNLVRGQQHGIALYKFDDGTAAGFQKERVLVDRIDPPTNASQTFDSRVVNDLKSEWTQLSDEPDKLEHISTDIEFVDGTEALLVQWDRVTRAWGTDIPEDGGWHNGAIDSWEHNPRYVFSTRDFIRSEESREIVGDSDSGGDRPRTVAYTSAFHWTKNLVAEAPVGDPDDMDGDRNPDNVNTPADDDRLPDAPDPWFSVTVWSPKGDTPDADIPGVVQGGTRIRKPTYFDMDYRQDPGRFTSSVADRYRSFPDKGWYGQSVDQDGDNSTSDTPAFFDDSGGPLGPGGGDTPNEEIERATEMDMPLAFSMQMLQKDDDFEQVGELLNVWLMGHMLEGAYDSTVLNARLNLPPSPFDPDTDPTHPDYLDPQMNAGTITTFSEFMYPTTSDWFAPWVATVHGSNVILDEKVNRLRFRPQGNGGGNFFATPFLMEGRSIVDINDTDGDSLVSDTVAISNPWPRQTITTRILDSFVCDGPGRPDLNGDGVGDDLNSKEAATVHSFYNANGFSGEATSGMININTASVEVMRMLPHMYKVVHETDINDSNVLDSTDKNPRSLIPESIYQWRELGSGGSNVLLNTGFTGGPDYSSGIDYDGIYNSDEESYYSQRSFTLGTLPGDGPKDTRGFSSPGEIGLLSQLGQADNIREPWHLESVHQSIRDSGAWRIDFAAMEPFLDATGTGEMIWLDADTNSSYDDGEPTAGAPLSTDVVSGKYFYDENSDEYFENTIIGDGVSGDSEEMNLLQSGISNLISTNSDMFTVHMRIRTFKRNPITGVWDATNLDYIVDDSRYVMLVDRSNVNSPSDKPRILYFEKLPN